MDQNNKSQAAHVNHPKIAHNIDHSKPKQHTNARNKTVKKVKKHLNEEEAGEIRIGSLPMEIPKYTHRTESETPRVQTPNTPDPVQHMVEAPLLEMDNQNYTPSRTPRSHREMQLTRTEPPLQGRKRE